MFSLFPSFSEVEKYLKEYNVDLNQIRKDEVRDMLRWGVISKQKADKYGASFDNIQLNPDKLEEIDLSKQWILLELDNMLPEEFWEKAIVEGGVPHYVWKSFSNYQKIDPKTRKLFENQNPDGQPKIIITPNHLNLPIDLCNISPKGQREKMADGQKYLGPNAWIKLFRQSLDRGLTELYQDKNLYDISANEYKKRIKEGIRDQKIDQYLLDVKTITQFADLASNDSTVPLLYFNPNPDDREVFLFYVISPDGAFDRRGGRLVLG